MGIGGIWQWVVICVVLMLIVLPIFYVKKKNRERLSSANADNSKLAGQWARNPYSKNFPEFVKSLWRGDVPLVWQVGWICLFRLRWRGCWFRRLLAWVRFKWFG